MKILIGSLLMFFWLQLDCLGRGEKVEQSPSFLSVQEGDSSSFNCTYTSTNSDYFFWYKQEPGKGPRFLIRIYLNEEKTEDQGFTVLLNKRDKHFSLLIKEAHAGDSATYFCAVSAQSGAGGKLHFGAGTRVIVKPYIRDPAPAVYQLKSSKSNNTICLFTDFDSRSNESTNLLKSDTETFQSDQTTLDMRSMDSKSNGILFWKSRPDFACDNISDKSLFHSSSGIVCDAKLVEKSFETDMHLNFKNLSVIGFRILLLKVAGFNLLMTLRLWSR